MDEQDYGFVRFASHLFAIASKLPVSRGDLSDRKLKRTDSLQEIAAQLGALTDAVDEAGLYLCLIEALLTVQDTLVPRRDSEALQEPTRLIASLPGTHHELGGWVYHWFRPTHSPALSEERNLRYDEALLEGSRPPAPAPRPMDHLGRLAMYWKEGSKGPDFVPPPSRYKRRVPLVEESGRDAQGDSFRIALCPLAGDFHPLFVLMEGGRHFQARRPEGMENPEKLTEHLTRVIETAATEKVHLLVLPELTVSSEAREQLVKALQKNRSRWPYGVVAGSFHEWPAGTTNAKALPCNEARLLDHKGQALLKHQKKKGFRIHRGYVTPRFFPEFRPEQLPSGVSEVFEGIEDGSALAVLDTALGRLALLICFDAIAADPERGYDHLVQCLRPDLLLVISMSPETERFEAFFNRMSEHWIGTLFVNAHCLCKPSEILASGNLALFEPEGAPPTRVRWRKGDARAERMYFKTPAPGPAGVVAHPLLGLIIDLGVYWEQRRRARPSGNS